MSELDSLGNARPTACLNESTSRMTRPIALTFAAAALACATLVSCGDRTAAPSVVGVNYTDQYISGFTVNGNYGANIPAYGGGNTFMCCIDVPIRWHDGLTAKVQWTADERDPAKWREAVVPIPRYEAKDTSYFAVHFYPDGTVKVLVTSMLYRHARYPLPPPTK